MRNETIRFRATPALRRTYCAAAHYLGCRNLSDFLVKAGNALVDQAIEKGADLKPAPKLIDARTVRAAKRG